MTGRTLRVGVAVAVQLLLVGVAVWSPLMARFTGEEVRLRVQAADTYEPFGDAYVELTYADLPEEHYPEGALSDDEVRRLDDRLGIAFVPLTQDGSVWVGGEVVREQPASGPFLRCDDTGWWLRCGIETAYVSSGSENDAVRDALRSGDAVAVVRVDDAGHAALVGVEAAG